MAIAVAASALALALAFVLRSDAMANVMWKRLFGAVAMGFGIGAMHYVGMAAAQFAPGTVCTAPGLQVDQQWLAFAVAASTFLFLGATMLILTIDVRLAHQLDAANQRIAALAREDPLTGSPTGARSSITSRRLAVRAIATSPSSRCCSSTSTASRISTTRSATRPATRCSWRSLHG